MWVTVPPPIMCTLFIILFNNVKSAINSVSHTILQLTVNAIDVISLLSAYLYCITTGECDLNIKVKRHLESVFVSLNELRGVFDSRDMRNAVDSNRLVVYFNYHV